MCLGPPPASFDFAATHKSNAYSSSEAGMALGGGDVDRANG